MKETEELYKEMKNEGDQENNFRATDRWNDMVSEGEIENLRKTSNKLRQEFEKV
jgi:hypothetical protein